MAPSHTTGPGGTIAVYGDPANPHVLTVYADLRCPFCKRMENGLGDAMRRAADEGRVQLHYRFATFLDDAAGGSGSHTALAALGAALDVGPQAFQAYLRTLYAHQPPEEDDAFSSTDLLLRLAEEVPGLRGPAFDRQVTEGAYTDWAREVSAAFEGSGVSSTPTVLLDGDQVPVLDSTGHAVAEHDLTALLPR